MLKMPKMHACIGPTDPRGKRPFPRDEVLTMNGDCGLLTCKFSSHTFKNHLQNHLDVVMIVQELAFSLQDQL